VLREYMSWPRCEAGQDVIEQYSELTNIHRRSSSSKLFSFPCLLLLLCLFHLGSLLIRALTENNVAVLEPAAPHVGRPLAALRRSDHRVGSTGRIHRPEGIGRRGREREDR
jgi:hypothetical protein